MEISYIYYYEMVNYFENYNLELVEKIVIRKAMDRHKGNISQAASELGLTRASLYRRMEKHGL